MEVTRRLIGGPSGEAVHKALEDLEHEVRSQSELEEELAQAKSALAALDEHPEIKKSQDLLKQVEEKVEVLEDCLKRFKEYKAKKRESTNPYRGNPTKKTFDRSKARQKNKQDKKARRRNRN